MNHKIKSLTLSKIKYHSTLRNDFIILPLQEFVEKLQSDRNGDSHFKNKFYTFLLPENPNPHGIISIDHQEFTIRPGNFLFISYNQVYHFQDVKNLTGYIMGFTQSFYNHIYTGNNLIKSDTALHQVSACIKLSEEKTGEIFKIFEEIHTECRKNNIFKKEIICLLLKAFVLRYTRNSSKKNKITRSMDHKKEIAEEYRSLVNKHFKDLKMPSQYAEKLNLSPNYLNVLVKDNFDISAGQLIRNRVILEAKRLLDHTTLSVTQVSYELGFHDNSHFCKYFKSAVKQSPQKYRSTGKKRIQ